MIGMQIKAIIEARNDDSKVLNLSTSKTLQNIGKISIIKLLSVVSKLLRVLYHIITYKPSLVYLSPSLLGIALYRDVAIKFMCIILRRRTVLHIHNRPVIHRQNSYINTIIYKLLFYKSDVILLSPYLYDELSDYIGRNRTYFCANGVFVQKKFRSKSNKTRILWFSNLLKSKGIDIFLEVIKELESRGLENLEFHIAGYEGDVTYSQLESSLVPLNNDLFFHGPIHDDQKWALLNKTDIFIFPTKNEAFGLVALEAMACGNIVISSNQGALPEFIVDGHSGYIINDNLKDGYVRIIEEVLRGKVDIDTMRELAWDLYQEKYTLEVFNLNFLSIISEVENEFSK